MIHVVALVASDGAAYEVWLGRWSSWLATVFLDFVQFPESDELLDVGCGTGARTLAMADRWPRGPSSQAMQMLQQFQELQALYIADRDRLRKELGL
jgi:hypothetical protein